MVNEKYHTTKQISTGYGLLVPVLLALTTCTILSATTQLEKLYVTKGSGHTTYTTNSLLPHIPMISDLDFYQSIYLSGVTLFLLLVFVIHQNQLLTRIKLNMPMVPSYLPYFGTAFQFLTNSPWDLMENWHRTYGPIYSFKLLGRTCIAVEKPEYLKDVLQSKIQNVKKDVAFSYKPFLPILGTGIVTSEGTSWMKQRRKISTTLKVDVLEIIPHATLSAVQRLMTKMDYCAEHKVPIEIAEELRHLTLQVISEAFLSLSPQESDATFAKMYLPIVEEGNKRVWKPERSYMFFMPFFWRHLLGVYKLNKYVSALIRKRWDERKSEVKNNQSCSMDKRNSKREDVLDKVLQHFEKENPGAQLSVGDIRQLRDEFKTFMLAGHETSAAMMTWTFYELMHNSDLMNKVRDESKQVFGDGHDWCNQDVSIPSREQLAELNLSESCLKESLRKYSVVPTVTRQIINDTKIGPHIIPSGCSVMISIQSIHHNAEFWSDPMKYDPTRFLNSSTPPVPFTFIPFIDGPRNCLGQYLALLESKIVISLLANRYTLTHKTDGLKGDPRHRYIVPIIPSEEINVMIERR